MTGSPYDIALLALLAILAAVGALVYGLGRLLFRLATRAPQQAMNAMSRSSRSFFGPSGSPEALCDRLLKKHPSLALGAHGGLTFVCSGCTGRLHFISDWTEIHFDLDDRIREAVEVSTPTFVTQLAEDDPDAFRVRGSDALYRQIFADADLARMLRDWGVPFEWSVGPAGFLLRFRSLPRNEEELWRWIKGAFRLLQAVPGFDAPLAGYRPADGHCQICGSSLGQGAVVRCRRCTTPHHEECWTYAGECSTFACKERWFVR